MKNAKMNMADVARFLAIREKIARQFGSGSVAQVASTLKELGVDIHRHTGIINDLSYVLVQTLEMATAMADMPVSVKA